MTIVQAFLPIASSDRVGRGDVDPAHVKLALRTLGGGVSVITAGRDDERMGATVTSATALSMDPPTMIVNINKASSTFPVIERFRHFCVNILSDDQHEIAGRFAGFGGVKGVDRYLGAQWTTLRSGAPVLANALAAVDCEVEEIIERHSHAIVLGRAIGVVVNSGQSLIYANGGYRKFI